MVTSEESSCPFCNLSDSPKSPFDVNEQIGNCNVSMVPALGMLMPGYLLAVTNEHITSFAQLGKGNLTEVNKSMQDYQDYLATFFGTYVRIEHGSDNIIECGSGGCIDHAHQHLVPDLEVSNFIQGKLPWQQLSCYEDIADFRGHPYIYLGKLGLHFVVADPKLPGQWTRRQIAEVMGLDNWDWALGQGALNLLITFAKLKKFMDRKLVVDIKNDSIEYVE
jgi:diadenosine tetraphosphate (Ap4A) HIT family hydrolase